MSEQPIDTEGPPSAAEALAIIERERTRTIAGRVPNLAVLYGTWGVAWLLIGLGYWAVATERITVASWIPGTVLAAIVLTSSVITTVTSIRGNRGVRSASELQGALYGNSWAISMIGLCLLLWGLERIGLPAGIEAVIYPGAFVFLAGVFYLAGGAVWQNVPQFVLGGWLIVVAAASVHAGSPANYLVMAFGGGGAMIAIATYHHVRRIR